MESIPDMNTPILIVDDDAGLLLSLKTALVSSGLPEPALLSDSRHVVEWLQRRNFRVVLLDLIMPHIPGMKVLARIKEEFPEIEVVIVTAVDEVSTAVEAMRFGAFDYLVKPLEKEKLIIVIENAFERYQLRHQLRILHSSPSFADLTNPEAFKEMITGSDAMASVFHQAEAASASHYSLILTGETGTGKEMLSRIIHRLSDRSKGPFVAVNMSASPASLFENSFFGHVKGAYTGAADEKRGFFEEAHGGTLFLDEITELPIDLQVKLLRAIEEGTFYRLGSSRFQNVDVRIIAATNQDIEEQVQQGKFRKDLFYRLNVLRIHLPPLRERPGDIIPLAYHFLKRHAAYNNKDIRSISPALEPFFLKHHYPGNVRELENIIASAVVAETDSVLHLKSAGKSLLSPGGSPTRIVPLEEVEKEHIAQVLETFGGNKTRAAKALGIGLRTLQRKLKTFEGR